MKEKDWINSLLIKNLNTRIMPLSFALAKTRNDPTLKIAPLFVWCAVLVGREDSSEAVLYMSRGE